MLSVVAVHSTGTQVSAEYGASWLAIDVELFTERYEVLITE
jgi:hypothetical protein